MAALDASATALVQKFREHPVDSRFRLRFSRDRNNRFGRFIWYHPGLERPYKPLTDRELRWLRVPLSLRRKLRPFLRQCRNLDRVKRRYIAIWIKLEGILRGASRKAGGILLHDARSSNRATEVA
jgi:hypothetical protein